MRIKVLTLLQVYSDPLSKSMVSGVKNNSMYAIDKLSQQCEKITTMVHELGIRSLC